MRWIIQNKSENIPDTAIVGAGAAGLMSAIHCAHLGLKVLLLDSREKFGAKILMSGGTRCNITNRIVTADDFETESRPALKAVLKAYPAAKTIRLFEALGVEMTEEPGGKFFPTSNSARTVLEALVGEVRRLGVNIQAPRRIESLARSGDLFELKGAGFSYQARSVLLATGGLSFPTSGSDGHGYTLAQGLGHHLVQTTPSLTPLVTDDKLWQSLSGVALPAIISLYQNGRLCKKFEGSLLFTHFGLSGPAVLNISRYWIRSTPEASPKIIVNFYPSASESELETSILQAVKSNPSQTLKVYLSQFFPKRFVDVLLTKAEIEPSTSLSQLKRDLRKRALAIITRSEISVTGSRGYEKAEVTAGGVTLSEVNKSTMESKLVRGLFFAGEILDMDGRIGGFNFQWAWSSAYVAAHGIKKFLKSSPSSMM